MELILIVAGLLLLDILAMRYGVDSRLLDRDQRPSLASSAMVRPRIRLVEVRRTSMRIRLAHGLRALAVRIEPAARVPGAPPLWVEELMSLAR